MAERNVTIKIRATDDFTPVLRRYQDAMGQAEQKTEQFGRTAQRGGGMFSQFGQEIQGAIAGLTLGAVSHAIGEFNALGIQVDKARQVFVQLNGGVGESNQLLARLQDTTGGVVDDLSLMNGANQLMSMGLASNQEEVARLTELAVKLGSAMGSDAAGSIDEFSKLLANESVLRLDTFGISSGKVRQRIDELLASGEALNRSEAFRLAVLEEGGRSLERLGDAANASATAAARLQTQLANLGQSVGGFVSSAVETGAGLIEQVGQVVEIVSAQHEAAVVEAGQQIQRVADASKLAADEVLRAWREVNLEINQGPGPEDSADNAGVMDVIRRAYGRSQQMSPGTQPSVRDLQLLAMEQLNTQALFDPQAAQMTEDFLASVVTHQADIEAGIERQNAALERQNALYEAQAQITDFRQVEARAEAAERVRLIIEESRLRRDAIEGDVDFYRQQVGVMAEAMRQQAIDVLRPQAMQEIWGLGARAGRYGAAMQNAPSAADYMQAQNNMRQLVAEMGFNMEDASVLSSGGREGFFTQEAADQMKAISDELQTQYQALLDMEATGLPFNEAALDHARELTDQAAAWADEMERGALLFENMSLSTALGTDEGRPILTQGTSALLSQLDAAGIPEAERGAWEDAFNLMAGTETELSQQFESEIIPAFIQLGQEQGVSTAAQYYKAFLEGLAMVEAGQIPMPGDPFNLAGLMNIGGAGGPGFTLRSGDTPSGLARQYGYGNNWQQFLRDAGKDPNDYSFRIGEQLNLGGANLTPMGHPDFGGGGALPTDEGQGEMQMPDFSGPMGQLGIMKDSAEGIKQSFDAIVGGIEPITVGMDPIADKAEKWAAHSRRIADETDRIHNRVKEIQGDHDVTFNLTTTTRDIPAFFMDWLRRGLLIIAGESGGNLPNTSQSGGKP